MDNKFQDNMDNTSEEEKALLAKQILDNPIFKQVFETIETEATEVWKSTTIDQKEERERLYSYIKYLFKFKSVLTGMIASVALKESQDKLFMEYEQDDYVNV